MALGDLNLDFSQLFFKAPWLVKEVINQYQKITKQKLSIQRIKTYAKVYAYRDLAYFIENKNVKKAKKQLKLIISNENMDNN